MQKKNIWKAGILGMFSACVLSCQSYAYWIEDEIGWKFLKSDGTYISNEWEWIDGNYDGFAECYYFQEDGYLLTNGSLGGHKVNRNGAWVVNGGVKKKDLRNFRGWYIINGEPMYLERDGIIWRERITPDNKYVDEHGWVVDESGIDEAMMAEKSADCRYIVINKATHHMEFWDHGVRKLTFLVSDSILDGDKEVEGDLKTPEGEFYVCRKIPTSNYHLALGLSYPDDDDAKRGFEAGLITETVHDEIVRAISKGRTPNWTTALGGYIEIHGNRQAAVDSTRGCVAMRNQDIDILFPLVERGDRVLILKD